MRRSVPSRVAFLAALVWLVASTLHLGHAQAADPIVYTIRMPAPDTHVADVEARVPTGGRASIEMMMAVWSPGFYRVENYATRIRDFAARAPDGTTLGVEVTRPNRWRIQTNGAPAAVVTYRVFCNERSVTTNWVSPDLVVLNGAPTAITLVEQGRRPHEIRLELPPGWRAMTGLDAAPDGVANHFRAADFDTLVDSPIVAGELKVQQFDVAGIPHYVVEGGEVGAWDGERAARDLKKIVEQETRLLGPLPYNKYDFLLVFRRGGGGLEHKNSTLATTGATSMDTPAGYQRWLSFISHEYFHAFNVKRLRPVELGPFDYEHEPHTPSLWISEGWTSYVGELLVARAGLITRDEYLQQMSAHIEQLQKAPGRLVQTLEQASLNVWTDSMSGTGTNPERSVSYYVKGEVVGFVLDARIRHATSGAKSLDDLMRVAYQRYGGDRGFTPDQFRATAEEVAGVDLKEWFRKAIASTDELDYQEALDWFGLRFLPPDAADPSKRWTLGVRDDATPAQQSRLREWLR